MILFDDEVRAFVPPARGAGALRALRTALVPARATMTEPDYAAAFRTLATRHRKRSLVVLFTDVREKQKHITTISALYFGLLLGLLLGRLLVFLAPDLHDG